MVSVKNGSHLDPDKAYKLYREYLADELRWFLGQPGVTESDVLRGHYEELCRAEPRDEFVRRLSEMTAERRSEYESRLVAGYHASLEADAAAAGRGAARPTDPADDPVTRAAAAAVDALLDRTPPGAS